MTEKPVPKEPDAVACKTCLEEIPESVSFSHEADEYTQHFCGIECYSRWKKEHKQENEEDQA